jgi:hypothetical protein
VASRWTVVEQFLYGKPHEYHRAAPQVMSRDGATAGHDAAVTRSVYGHPHPVPPRHRRESEPRRVWPRAFTCLTVLDAATPDAPSY